MPDHRPPQARPTLRPRGMQLRSRQLVRAAALGVVVWAASASFAASPATACIGGLPFDVAVAHQQGGLLRALVTAAHDRPDFTTDLTLSQTQVLRGDPPLAAEVHAVVGLTCEQHADAGETVILVFNVAGLTWPNPLPLVYVIDGADALDPGVVSAALTAVPATDTVVGDYRPEDSYAAHRMVLVAFAGALTFVLALRRARLR